MFKSEKDGRGVRCVILGTDGCRFRGKLHRMQEKQIFISATVSERVQTKEAKAAKLNKSLKSGETNVTAFGKTNNLSKTREVEPHLKLNCAVTVYDSSSDDPAVVQTDANRHCDHRAEAEFEPDLQETK